MPVVNIAGCPTHPGWVVDTLALALEGFAASDLDALWAAAALRRPSGAPRLPAQ
jgi:Ni,Fe-hydrogenase I small subunit